MTTTKYFRSAEQYTVGAHKDRRLVSPAPAWVAIALTIRGHRIGYAHPDWRESARYAGAWAQKPRLWTQHLTVAANLLRDNTSSGT